MAEGNPGGVSPLRHAELGSPMESWMVYVRDVVFICVYVENPTADDWGPMETHGTGHYNSQSG